MRSIPWNQQAMRLLQSRIGKTAAVFPVIFLAALSGSSLSLAQIFLAREEFGASPTVLGLLGACWGSSYVVGCFLFRPLFNRIAPRFCMLGALSWLTVVTGGMAMAPSLGAIFLAVAGVGVGLSFFWPSTAAWMSVGGDSKELAHAAGRFNLCWCSAAMLGPATAGLLGAVDGRLAVAASTILYLVAACLLLGGMLALPRLRDADSAGAPTSPIEGPSPGDGVWQRFPAWLGVALSFAGVGALVTVFPVSAVEDLGMHKPVIGALLSIRVVTLGVGLFLLSRVRFWHLRTWPMLVGTGLLGVVFASMAWPHSTAPLAILLGISGILVAMGYTSSQFHSVVGSSGGGSRMAVNEGLVAMGANVGSVIGGALYELGGVVTFYGGIGALTLVGTLVQWRLARHYRRTSSHQAATGTPPERAADGNP